MTLTTLKHYKSYFGAGSMHFDDFFRLIIWCRALNVKNFASELHEILKLDVILGFKRTSE
ncbi:hypothetical protein BpHYR1_007868 [Brachionus plicatilis]|uniref:Uncharacterized protein n=1 Tax=Brachionus plicatilis TaxID=10195 RepID=A0A3M7STC3_BRAPC|nr:hypothetical protein BpHYR1_007868 [Brachionus plicatilis]